MDHCGDWSCRRAAVIAGFIEWPKTLAYEAKVFLMLCKSSNRCILIFKEVKNMCFSSNAIELQAYSFTEKINKGNKYKLVQIDFLGDKSVKVDSGTSLASQLKHISDLPLIKKVLLEDADGKQYHVEPNELGLQFSNGELTYKQYLLAKRTGSRNLLFYTLGFTGIFILMAGTFIGNFL
jgi:hypothetical protein